MSKLDKAELEKAIQETEKEINGLQQEFKDAPLHKQNKIQRKMKELQIKQLWYLDQIDFWNNKK
ncbi:hypothetical protein F9B85_10665 [Heliorestis acidaminivorans]|uniref:50S ribosomal protein L29 n=1 Tax=Heliorestis acidaminivorans TaxID=553427 RepID=A0A6I0F4B5_9FIRM|nr:hypothetical protein [Heliorestis acidaminivorans]KAB2952010.1 hypothetical protein F9B85_10665 [Heliorestis acidaminivorans]